MAVSFIAGERFTHLPDLHLSGFREVLPYGEVQLLIDVAREQVAEIDNIIHRRHPVAVMGGCRCKPMYWPCDGGV